MKQLIYADNAATTKLDKDAFEAMTPWLLEEYGNVSQPYAFSRNPKKALLEARKIIAGCIGALPEEIYFTSGGTESDNWVIKSSALSDPNKRAMITSAFEHHAVLHSCAAIERLGYPVAYMLPTANGYITPDNLGKVITRNTRLVSVMFANNEIGSIQPIRELCAIAHASGALFHTDAVQAVGHIKIDVHELGVDFLSASAHKFNGPKGIGFLYVRSGIRLAPYMDGGAQEFGLRSGTENVAGIVGMAVALRNNCAEIDTNSAYLQRLESCLIGSLNASGIDYRQNGGLNRIPGSISLSFKGIDGEMLLHRLDLMGICVSTGAACNGEDTQISHVLDAIGLSPEYARGTIRVTLSKYNTIDDVLKISNAILRIVIK